MSEGGLAAHLVAGRPDGFRLEMGFAIPPRTTVALLGPNGAGKSTAVACLAGLLPLDAGHIALGSEVLDDPSTNTFVPAAKRPIGVVFQDYLLFPHLSVSENVAFGPRSRGVGRRQAVERAQRWLAVAGLDGLERRRPAELSGGQAQRVALARALATDPGLLLLDEPLSALDVTTRTEMRHSLRQHLDEFAGPRLLITHDPTEAFLLADEILVVEDGTVTQAGTAEEIRLRPRSRYAADLAGSNLVTGTAHDGTVDVGDHDLLVADHTLDGPVLVTIRPSSVALHAEPPAGSPRNVWATTIQRVEDLGERIRLLTGPPLALTVEVTDDARTALALEVGQTVWASVKATDIGVEPDEPAPGREPPG